MQKSQDIKTDGQSEYKAPHLSDYGAVSDLTKTISGDTGCDGGYPSYTAST